MVETLWLYFNLCHAPSPSAVYPPMLMSMELEEAPASRANIHFPDLNVREAKFYCDQVFIDASIDTNRTIVRAMLHPSLLLAQSDFQYRMNYMLL